MTGSKADYLLLLPTVYSKVFTQQLLLLVLFQLVLGLFSLVKKQIFRNSQPSFPLFFRKKNQFSQSEITFYPAPPRTRRLRGKFQQVDRQTYVAHIPPLRGWYSRDSLCHGVGARVAYINTKIQMRSLSFVRPLSYRICALGSALQTTILV